MLGKKHNAAGETAVEKPLRGKVPNQTFPPSLEIAQRTRDSHFPPAAATAGLRLHFQCLDDRPQGYIFKWLDTARLSEAGRLLQEPRTPSNVNTQQRIVVLRRGGCFVGNLFLLNNLKK